MNLLTVLLQSDPSASRGLYEMLMIGAIIVVFYLFMIRPQMKKSKETKKFREGLAKGQKVVTIGGLHGKILEVTDTTVLLDAGGARLRFEKSAISPDNTPGEQQLTAAKEG